MPAIAIAVGKDARRICLEVSKQVFTEIFNGCRDFQKPINFSDMVEGSRNNKKYINNT